MDIFPAVDYSSQIFVESEKSDDDQSSSVVKPSSNKRKINPNVQTTFSGRKLKERKIDNAESSDSDSKFEAVSVNYKSKREQLSGPSDQGATATLVNINNQMCMEVTVGNLSNFRKLKPNLTGMLKQFLKKVNKSMLN